MHSGSPAIAQEEGRTQRHASAAVDLLVYAAILAIGGFYLYSHLRSPDFPFEDVAYYEQAKSILQDGYYGFQSVPERVQPPGLPLLLAFICRIAGCQYGVLLSSMTVLIILGFLVWYQIIRQAAGRVVAAATCLLLPLSPGLFHFGTREILPSTPYFFASGLALWIILKLDVAKTRLRRYLLSAVLALIVGFSILIQSAAIALVGAMLAVIAFTWLRDQGKAAYRLKVFLPAILLGIATQFVWMHQGSNPPDWPLPGYPGSYTQQLRLKLGNYPELGYANAADVYLRVKRNVGERIAVLAEMLTAHWIHRSYSNVVVAIPLFLVAVGWITSLWGTGEDILAWYFLGFETIYILWPWFVEFRFVFPVAPLACLFAYRGARRVAAWSRLHPRRVAACFLPCGVALFAVAFRNSLAAGASWQYGVQSKFSAAFWALALLFAVWVAWKNRLPVQLTQVLGPPAPRSAAIGSVSLTVPRMAPLVVAVLVAAGAISQDIAIARENISFGKDRLPRIPDIVAAQWVRLHTDPQDVIAARHVPLVYHHSHRRVIWFAPIVRPQVLMEGLRRHNIHYVIVIDRDYSYYLPPDEICFEIMEKQYPRAFRLAAQIGQARIFEVIPEGADNLAAP